MPEKIASLKMTTYDLKVIWLVINFFFLKVLDLQAILINRKLTFLEELRTFS